MTGEAATYEGRYGSDAVPGHPGLDVLAANKWFEYGLSKLLGFFAVVNNAGSYGSPPDPFGVGAVGLIRPVGRCTPASIAAERTAGYCGFGSVTADNPYELNLGPNALRGLPKGL